jgi:hypothetical protein
MGESPIMSAIYEATSWEGNHGKTTCTVTGSITGCNVHSQDCSSCARRLLRADMVCRQITSCWPQYILSEVTKALCQA